MSEMNLLSRVQEADVTAEAVTQTFQELARRHAREYAEILKTKLRQAELKAMAPVVDSAGKSLERGSKVDTPTGRVATVVRVDPRSRRCVVEYRGGEQQNVTGSRLTIKAAPVKLVKAS